MNRKFIVWSMMLMVCMASAQIDRDTIVTKQSAQPEVNQSATTPETRKDNAARTTQKNKDTVANTNTNTRNNKSNIKNKKK